MISTPDLIDSLVANVTPVHRLRPPTARALGWLLFAGLMLALVAVGHGVRPDLELRLQQPIFLIGVAASLLTGVLAAITSTALSLFHPLDATVMILIWNVGIAAVLVTLGSLYGRRIFAWVAPR